MLWLLLGLGLLLASSGVVSATETALFGLSRQALHRFRDAKRPLHRRVFALMQHPRRVLMLVLVANTAVNVAIFSVSFFALRHIVQGSPVAEAAFGMLVPVAVIVFGEMLPKAVAFSGARRFAPAAAGVIGLLRVVFGAVEWVLAALVVDPLTRLLSPSPPPNRDVGTDELRLLVEQSAKEGVINPVENGMLQAIVAMGDATVREIMTPRVDIRSVSLDADRASILSTFREAKCRRLPVCGRGLDDIRGVLYARDLYLEPRAPIRSLMRRVRFVPEQVNLTQLLRQFRLERIQMAIVVDEFGGTAGLVTAEDVVEWVAGDLPDADTARPATSTERIDQDLYRISGDLSARVWADRFAVAEIDREVDTVAGLILARLGRVPQVGDSIQIRNLTLTVESMSGRRIERVLLRLDERGEPVTDHAA